MRKTYRSRNAKSKKTRKHRKRMHGKSRKGGISPEASFEKIFTDRMRAKHQGQVGIFANPPYLEDRIEIANKMQEENNAYRDIEIDFYTHPILYLNPRNLCDRRVKAANYLAKKTHEDIVYLMQNSAHLISRGINVNERIDVASDLIRRLNNVIDQCTRVDTDTEDEDSVEDSVEDEDSATGGARRNRRNRRSRKNRKSRRRMKGG